MSNPVFCKTESGKAEIARRSGNLTTDVRQVLIMVNGIDSASALIARGLPRLQEHLSHLLALGLIAPVPEKAEWQSTSPAPLRPTIPAAAPSDEPDPRIDDQCRIVLAILQQHFGPNATDVAQDMLMARTVDEFNAAIDAIESRMIGHLGRKHALRESQPMRLLPDLPDERFG